ncbi:MAG: M14 family metallopeptidase [Salegentibacter sp.]|uniref:M14 family metallopeptidase n=1 Tax=Salegentibacter sp. TaxID=1903072 RepID=UPI00286FB942|nr:M14 family metallopeptidase [Salegentibacter sp.]MDR9456479.1 M14 family metallopeptidase [Salegentibacter sp.]
MKNFSTLSIFFLFITFGLSAQQDNFFKKLYAKYPDYKEESINQRRFTHELVIDLIKKLESNSEFRINKVGESIEGRSLNLLSIGTGETDVLLWSQMHGDESTATMTLFDIFNFLNVEDFKAEKELMLKEVTLHFLPMLNPDGAEKFQRRNALGVDVNRDALRLQSPESKTLKKVRDSLDADFGFNLHDQSRYYNAEGTEKPATISFLAPAYDYEKSINKVRGNAMKLIVLMNGVLQNYAPGQVGRYNDDFEPRAFGDNIQKWGTSTILIESGGYPDDPEKQEIRKLNFVAILAAVFAIADEDYKTVDIAEYENIPQNDSKLYDLKLTEVTYELLGNEYILDLGINHSEVPGDTPQKYSYRAYVADRGDLSTNYAYNSKDLLGYKLISGKVYPEILPDVEAVGKLDFEELMEQAYAYIPVENLPEKENFTDYPVNLVSPDFKVSEDISHSFFLEKDGETEYAVINGFLVKIGEEPSAVKNALILK